MATLKVHQNGKIKEAEADLGEVLLNVLRDNGFDIYSPCGGNGTCGKCKVLVKGEGIVTSCIFTVYDSMELVLPDKREAKVLVAQHAHTIQLPLMPGPAGDLSGYPHGVAIDIGTTSLVFYLVNLITGTVVETRAILNPQAKYGADVISRIQFTASQKDGLQVLQREIINVINQELVHLVQFGGISANEIINITIAGHTTMLHLLLGVDPLSLALAPFKAQFLDEQLRRGSELEIKCFPGAEIKILPSISAYVGADIVAGLASIAPSENYHNYLFMDIGTNGELALVTGDRIWCCATAAGPAFEGARISCGMGAVEGAISAYGDDGYIVLGDEKPAGLCGSGLIDLVAWLCENKKIDSEGQLDHDFLIVPASVSGTGEDISLNQTDIREVQLAKSAIASGIRILLKQSGLTFDQLDLLFLAGGFGNYINIDSAIRIGMIPYQLKDRIIPLGNTSGTGALAALKSTRFDDAMKAVISKSILVELANDEDFAMEFAMNMLF
ncbi:MAG: DUF4445 domain-containing protein [Bacteroidales bacterium]|nr:DUF4445 domain-containing protein [Bacteroidales bacterium]